MRRKRNARNGMHVALASTQQVKTAASPEYVFTLTKPSTVTSCIPRAPFEIHDFSEILRNLHCFLQIDLHLYIASIPKSTVLFPTNPMVQQDPDRLTMHELSLLLKRWCPHLQTWPHLAVTAGSCYNLQASRSTLSPSAILNVTLHSPLIRRWCDATYATRCECDASLLDLRVLTFRVVQLGLFKYRIGQDWKT